MKYFLIEYERSSATLRQLKAFTDQSEALECRFRLEDAESELTDIELVVLGAESLEALKRTHGRYFHRLLSTCGLSDADCIVACGEDPEVPELEDPVQVDLYLDVLICIEAECTAAPDLALCIDEVLGTEGACVAAAHPCELGEPPPPEPSPCLAAWQCSIDCGGSSEQGCTDACLEGLDVDTLTLMLALAECMVTACEGSEDPECLDKAVEDNGACSPAWQACIAPG